MDELEQRIDSVKKDDTNINCVGTALYVAGLRPNEEYLWWTWNETKEALNKIEGTVKPRIGDLAIFKDTKNNSDHIGVIIKTEPLTIFHRRAEGIRTDDIEIFKQEYFPNHKIEYLRIKGK